MLSATEQKSLLTKPPVGHVTGSSGHRLSPTHEHTLPCSVTRHRSHVVPMSSGDGLSFVQTFLNMTVLSMTDTWHNDTVTIALDNGCRWQWSALVCTNQVRGTNKMLSTHLVIIYFIFSSQAASCIFIFTEHCPVIAEVRMQSDHMTDPPLQVGQ